MHCTLVFTGQGNHYPKMGQNIPYMNEGLEFLATKPGLENIRHHWLEGTHLEKTEYAQPLIGLISALQLFQMFKNINFLNSKNIQINALGHSFGELTALFSAGFFGEVSTHWEIYKKSMYHFLNVSYKRGQFIAREIHKNNESTLKTGMLAIMANEEQTEQLLTKFKNNNITIANINSNKQTIVSGSLKSLINFKSYCKNKDENNIKRFPCTLLKVPIGFHAKQLKEAGENFENYLKTIQTFSLNFPVLRNTDAKIHSFQKEHNIAHELGKQIYHPVLFSKQINNVKNQTQLFIECGPKQTMSTLIKHHFNNEVKIISLGHNGTSEQSHSENEYLNEQINIIKQEISAHI